MSETCLAMERKLRLLTDPLSPSRPGDWLAEHPQVAQRAVGFHWAVNL